MQSRASLIVITCGNCTAGDDALGPVLAGDLRRAPLEGVHLIDAAMAPGLLLDRLEPCRALLVVDAVYQEGSPPGSIVDMDWFSGARPQLAAERALSSHGWSIAGQLDLARALDLLPPSVHVLGVTILPAQAGDAASPDLSQWVLAVRGRIAEHARRVRLRFPADSVT